MLVAGKLEEGACIWTCMIVATPVFTLNYSEFFQFSKKQIMVLPLFTRYGIFVFSLSQLKHVVLGT